MKKFKLFFDITEEEVWLNKMCEKGWAVKKYFLGMYTFEKCEKGEYIYQIDLAYNRQKDEYLEFLEESGVEVVFIWYNSVILRKKSSEGAFELYSDVESKIRQYKKIKNIFSSVLICLSVGLVTELIGLIKSSIRLFYAVFILFIFVIVIVEIFKILLRINSKIKKLKIQ